MNYVPLRHEILVYLFDFDFQLSNVSRKFYSKRFLKSSLETKFRHGHRFKPGQF